MRLGIAILCLEIVLISGKMSENTIKESLTSNKKQGRELNLFSHLINKLPEMHIKRAIQYLIKNLGVAIIDVIYEQCVY